MFDVWLGDVELTALVLIVSILVILPAQFLLCCKVRSRILRLLPVLILSVPTILFTVLSVTVTGWDAIGYLFLAIFSGFMLFMCGVGWGIWGISRLIRKNSRSSK